MDFELEDETLEALLEGLEDWASQTMRDAAEEAQKLDVVPQFLSPQDFWAKHPSLAAAATTTTTLAREDDVEEEAENEKFSTVPSPPPSAQDIARQEQFLKLKLRANACDALLVHVDRALCDLDSIESQHKLVSEKTSSLHEVCKRLLAEQNKLDKIVSGIQTPMSYFISLDEICPRFGLAAVGGAAAGAKPANKVPVLHPDDEQFKRDMARLDECIHFVSTHAHYHDASEYLERFIQCQIQGMRMIETWAMREISRLEASVTGKQQQMQAGGLRTASFLDDSALYFRFLEKGKLLRASLAELEKRPKISLDFVHAILSQLCTLRLKLLKNLVKSSPEMMATPPPNGAATTITSKLLIGSEFLSRVCVAEHAVISSFFSLPAAKQIFASRQGKQVHNATEQTAMRHLDEDEDDEFAQVQESLHQVDPFFEFLEAICTCLFDMVRPLIVKENDLERLCDAASAVESTIQELEARMDQDAAEPLEYVLTRIALDLQERICFCFVRIVREDISSPKNTNKWLEENMLKTWFPSLEITLATLSKVYRTVDSNVFEQLATEAVSACTQALCDMSRTIYQKRTPDEGDLFLIQHLLILREQISPFRAMLTSKERKIDFTPTSRALRNLLQFKRPAARSLLSMLRFAGPTLQETDLNSKRDLDQRLRHASETFILRVSKRALGPLLEFVDASQAYLQREDATWEGLCAQDFASLTALRLGITYCEQNTAREITAARELAIKFLNNAQTRGVLFHAIETNAFKIVNTASNFALDMFKEDAELNDRLRELVRVVGAIKTQ